jgi:hypothetical protein
MLEFSLCSFYLIIIIRFKAKVLTLGFKSIFHRCAWIFVISFYLDKFYLCDALTWREELCVWFLNNSWDLKKNILPKNCKAILFSLLWYKIITPFISCLLLVLLLCGKGYKIWELFVCVDSSKRNESERADGCDFSWQLNTTTEMSLQLVLILFSLILLVSLPLLT